MKHQKRIRQRTKKRRNTRQGGGVGASIFDSMVNTIKNTIGTGSGIGKGTKKKESSKMICNPAASKNAADPTTCYSKDVLYKIRDAYNENHKDNPIRDDLCAKGILKELRCRLLPKCTKEDCWLNLLPKSQKELLDQEVFAPDQPKEWESNPDEWLSNFDIQNVLDQYENAYPNFELLGPTPIDFDSKTSQGKCVSPEICNFNLAKYREQGTTDVAFVFNLDKHNQPGSHWTSMYLSLPKRKLFYFDSALNDVPKEIEVLKDRIIKQAEDLGLTITFDTNTIQHQKENTECGMYSLFFILTLLTGHCGGKGKKITFENAIKMFKCKERIPDKLVFEFRDRYYNDPDSTE